MTMRKDMDIIHQHTDGVRAVWALDLTEAFPYAVHGQCTRSLILHHDHTYRDTARDASEFQAWEIGVLVDDVHIGTNSTSVRKMSNRVSRLGNHHGPWRFNTRRSSGGGGGAPCMHPLSTVFFPPLPYILHRKQYEKHENIARNTTESRQAPAELDPCGASWGAVEV